MKSQLFLGIAKRLFGLPSLAATLTILSPSMVLAGSFTSMTTTLPPSFSPGHMLLLTDGRVMVQNLGGTAWEILSPDSSGHYVGGSWTNGGSMHYQRLYYSSAVLQNGKVFVAGGEYNDEGLFGDPAGATAEIFDPQANSGFGTWTLINPPTSLLDPTQPSPALASGNQAFWDSECVVLPNGNVLVAPVGPNVWGGNLIYNPFANSWSAGGTTTSGYQDEASWVKLPDDSILTIDPYGTDCQRYIPSLNTWITDQAVPVSLYSTNGEIGAAMLMTNGTVLYVGGANSSKTEIYTPSGTTNSGSWSAGPNLPGGLVMRDAPGCVLNNGKLLLGLVGPNNDNPICFYEYNPSTGGFTYIFSDSSAISDKMSLLQLPDGNVLFSDAHNVYVYETDPTPVAAGRPAIQEVQWNPDGSLHITGTGFTGITQGAMYGDDAQQDSNYPMVRFTDGSGNVYYGRTYNWSSTSVVTGGRVITTDVSLPPSVYDFPGNYSLQVVANGNPSSAVAFNSPVWVDFTVYFSSFEFGWFPFPYQHLHQGVSAVTSGGTIAIDANNNSGTSIGHETVPYTINTPMTIISVNGASTIRN